MSENDAVGVELTPFDEMRAGGFFQFRTGGPWHQIERIESNRFGYWFIQTVGSDPKLGPFFMGDKPRPYRSDTPDGFTVVYEQVAADA